MGGMFPHVPFSLIMVKFCVVLLLTLSKNSGASKWFNLAFYILIKNPFGSPVVFADEGGIMSVTINFPLLCINIYFAHTWRYTMENDSNKE